MYIIEIKLDESLKLFAYSHNMPLEKGTKVIVDTAGIINLATVINSRPIKCCEKNNHKKVIRLAGKKDLELSKELEKKVSEVKISINNTIKELNLNMAVKKVVLGLDSKGIKIIYTAPERVLFNDLVKILSTKYKSRILMQQINEREQASTIPSYGICGQKLCCSKILKTIPSVKLTTVRGQNVSISPQTNEGVCGKLKCCYNYEIDTYKELKELFPKINQFVKYRDKMMKVTSLNFFSKICNLKDKKGTEIEASIDDIDWK